MLTTGGNLICTHIIHAAVMGSDLKTDPDTIAAATSPCSRGRQAPPHVGRHAGARHRGGARPARGGRPTRCSPSWWRTSRPARAPSKRVVFVLYLDDAYKAFSATLARLGGA